MGEKYTIKSVFRLLVGFITFRGFFVLILFLIIAPQYWKGRKEFLAEKQALSHEIRGELQNRIDTMKPISDKIYRYIDDEFSKHRAKLAKEVEEIEQKKKMQQERALLGQEERKISFWEQMEKHEAKRRAQDEIERKKRAEIFEQSSREFQEKIKKGRRDWCRCHQFASLSSMCDGLEEEKAEGIKDLSNITKKQENQKHTTLNIPLNFKYEIKE